MARDKLLERISGCFLGLAVGDALGVPVEFRSRKDLDARPVDGMRGYGTWHQAPGTWSDDSSMTFCLAESLAGSYDLRDIANGFLRWYREGYWAAHYHVFDIGETTRHALSRIKGGEDPLFSGGLDVESNGNGSLMRIAPVALYSHGLNEADFFARIREVSGITHAHFRSVFSCYLFGTIVREILCNKSKSEALASAAARVKEFAAVSEFNRDELGRFERILSGRLLQAERNSINSDGYVVSTLEAAIWSFLTTDNYKDAVLKAVNLGEDTDTTACVTGALAGLYYGEAAIPSQWREVLAREKDILKLSCDFTESLKNRILPEKT
ncbi:ADP-ribosylglycohydrolase family protein [Chryseolinea sp. T2]|uniref:ADP-ribosylglycohydrolase family protein n=1 Tax=Chryseolinea sp. T2 TaxID=3129255 RepID=UPI0030773B45